MKHARLLELVKLACDLNGMPNLKDTILVTYSNRMTSAMGSCQSLGWNRYKIKLSRPLFALATIEDQENTLVHEVCHAVDYHNQKRMSHGSSWKRVMRKTGFAVEVHHTVDNSSIRKKRIRFIYTCTNCDKVYRLTKGKHLKNESLLKNYGHSRYSCSTCRKDLKFTGERQEI